MPQHTHLSNLKTLEAFLLDVNLSDRDVIKFEARWGEEPIVHVTNFAFMKAAPAHTNWEEQIGCGGNVHRSAKTNGVKLVSVFRRESL